MSRQSNRTSGWWTAFVVCAGLLATGTAAWLWRPGNHVHREPPPPSSVSHPSTGRVVFATHEIETAFARAAEKLRSSVNAAMARQTLDELKARLAGMPGPAGVAAVRAELNSGRDAPSGLGFKVTTGGGLGEWPSLRVFLLDYLAQVDPGAAAEIGREILASKTSPEEWAVALRNCARVSSDESGRMFLEAKMRELLTHEPWQLEASEGFLEAFDVAVHLRGASLVPELTALVRKTDNRAVARAAYLALDRLTISDPALMLTRLAEEPQLMEGREVTRANYFARAALGDPAQRAVVERYLLDPRRTAEEVRTFAGLYPNANYMVSPNLLTLVVTPTRADLDRLDQTALRALNEWLADARFAALRPQLEKARVRVENRVAPGMGR